MRNILIIAALWAGLEACGYKIQMLGVQRSSSGSQPVKRKSMYKLISDNRLARRNYEFLDRIEAGISLKGSEVKSCREGRMNIRDAYAQMKDDEMWLLNAHIAQYENTGRYDQHEPKRPRKLLLHKSQIRKFDQKLRDRGITMVPVRVYFSDNNLIKVELALARGKKIHDKREDIKQKEAERDIRRIMKG